VESDQLASDSATTVDNVNTKPDEDDVEGGPDVATGDAESPGHAPEPSARNEVGDTPPFGKDDADERPDDDNEAAQPDKRSVEQETVDEVVAQGFETWLRLSHWAKVNDLLEPRERSLAYNVGNRIRREIEPSFPQALWAKAILEKVIEAGFDVSGSDEQGGSSRVGQATHANGVLV
jgi:hypothetical protein